ncbi:MULTISPECIES: ATP-binding protein [unclassified Ruegeria]|uniref:ATP-binding protein n=1 Tax=unclassified Ruegeria TaxID=2625375 RepID=UPI001488A9A0|nr:MULTISPECIES: ATP-binding protein [unclassified Ruegeria]NOD75546.1 two-component sensor histidine kinase [Ruegeria sp. HKCCD4332]NOD87528.1 two-component sensor histidine kinase [Ruegeria sp. HKCCD4318]NOD91625.1 two-component sensor histidine kinase [Ruegeria sp. HKCCD4884]NOE13083.1 two-component sensor histidine kinase [Ruegeria sp. HKCCD4318-2]NOG08749.1 two-component sensor histidine kinase [Ruegeria sp. HKCCD4315]
MSSQWLKPYLPRSLYARAALILVLPVIVLLLVVGIAFIQKHLEDVTGQMTSAASREVTLITTMIADAETQQEAVAAMRPDLQALEMQARFLGVNEEPMIGARRWYDFIAPQVQADLQANLPDLVAVALPTSREARVYMQTHLGVLQLTFDRRRLSPVAPHQLIVTMVFFAVIMTTISFLYMRNQLRPITRLADAAQAFGRGRVVPYTPGGAIEVRAAGNAFLDMRARIERQIEQRTLMLSGVSHDLRTPLTRLKLGLSMLPEDEAAPLQQDVTEMQSLLDAFLDFTRGAAEGSPEEVQPDVFIRQIVEDAKRAGHQADLIGVEGQGTVMLRPMAIRRAVENLIGNAVRYGSRADVSLTLNPKSMRIRVEDDGPGIPVEERTEAVKPFTRLDPARNQNKGSGVGLGLAIVADIARAHGGTLRLAKSERLGGLCADIIIGR